MKSFYPPIFDSNLGADTHQTGRRASAAGAGKRAAQRTRASRLAQRTRASRLAQRTRTSARATITILGDELTHFSLSHVNPKYSESCSIFCYTCPLSLPPVKGVPVLPAEGIIFLTASQPVDVTCSSAQKII